MNHRMHVLIGYAAGLGALVGGAVAANGQKPGWRHEEVNWRMTGGTRVRAVRYPQDVTLPILLSPQERQRPQVSRKALGPEAAARLLPDTPALAAATVYATVIDSPPINGFVPWIAVVTTDASGEELELDAVPSPFVVGDPMPDPRTADYVIGLYDTAASAHVMGNEAATSLGMFNGSPDFVTGSTIEISGVVDSVEAWVSMPIGLFIDGLSAIDPNTLELDTSGMVGEWNVSIAVGQPVTPPQPDLPTAIGSPLAVYFAAVVDNEQWHAISYGGENYTAPDIQFYDLDDAAIPDYPNLVPLELRPLGGGSVQYVPCTGLYGPCPDGLWAPEIPSIIVGNSSQSLFFIGSGVDLTDGDHSAIDKDRFMLDTGAQVTVVGFRVGARLGLDPAHPEFQVLIQGVTGETSWEPGFFIDTLDIPALGEWLSYTNVPVVLLDVASPEGGTLDGIIGMNLMVDYNFVLRGGGLFGQADPSLEVQLIMPPIDADFDDDCDVDQEDFGHLQACLTGPDVPQTDADCLDARLDDDDDVDQSDTGMFLARMSGPGVPAGPDYAP